MDKRLGNWADHEVNMIYTLSAADIQIGSSCELHTVFYND